MSARHFAVVLIAGVAAGCAGLPHKHPPVQLATSAPTDGLEVPESGEWPALEWWQRYQDPTLNQLIAVGGANSPTLANAQSRFDSARQSVRLAAAESGAHLEANTDANRQRLSDNGLFPPQLLGFSWYDQFDLGLQASYTFDWWGKQRNAVESAMDQAQAARADRSAAALMLASSIADTYFGWQADQARLSLARETVATVVAEGQVSAARVRADLEAADELNRAELALAAAREQAAQIEGSAKLRLVALAALVGRSVAELPPLMAQPLPRVANTLPDNVKLDLIARRADIAASRLRVEAAEKNLASARADFFPDVTINGMLGLSSLDVGNLLKYGSRVPQVAAAIHLPIFDAGRLKARYGGAQAAIDAAVSTYQDTVISAARDVATQATLRAQIEAQRAQRQLEVDSALRIKPPAAARVRQGLTDSRTELTATETWLQQRDGLLQLDSAALSADIALQRALGGGYDNPARRTAALPATTATP